MKLKLQIVTLIVWPAYMWCQLICFLFGLSEEEVEHVAQVTEGRDI